LKYFIAQGYALGRQDRYENPNNARQLKEEIDEMTGEKPLEDAKRGVEEFVEFIDSGEEASVEREVGVFMGLLRIR